MKLNLASLTDSIAHVEIEGKMTSEDLRPGAANPLETAIGPDWAANKVLIDLGRATFIDSSAIGWLLTCSKQCKNKGGMLVLHSAPPTVSQVFNLLKIGSILPIVPNQPAAQALATGGARK